MSYTMTEDERAERAKTKAMHHAVRSLMERSSMRGRYRNLAWALVRGIPFRRVERTHTIQTVGGLPADRHSVPVPTRAEAYEHNMPDSLALHRFLAAAGVDRGKSEIEAWLANPDGAIAAPVAQEKIKHSLEYREGTEDYSAQAFAASNPTVLAYGTGPTQAVAVKVAREALVALMAATKVRDADRGFTLPSKMRDDNATRVIARY